MRNLTLVEKNNNINKRKQLPARAIHEGPISTPNPTLQFLCKDFYVQPGLGRKFLVRRTWSGQKLLPLQFPGLLLPYQGKPGSLTKDSLLPQPESDGKSPETVGSGVELGS